MIIVLYILLAASAFATSDIKSEQNAIFLNEIFSTKYAFAPVDSTNIECRRQSQEFLKALDNLELWALQMHDATAKISSGILNGNINQLGDFNQCLNIKSNITKGQYCLVKAFIEPITKSQSILNIYDLAYSHRMAHTTPFNTLKMFPSFNDISWGFCVPSGCTSDDVNKSLNNLAKKFNSTSLNIHITIDKNSCVIKKSEPIRLTVILTGLFVAFVCILAAIGTVIELLKKENKASSSGKILTKAPLPSKVNLYKRLVTRIALEFSLKKNIKLLLSTVEGDDLSYINGIRTIMAIIIYIIHRQLIRLFMPLSNRTELAEFLEGDWTMFFRSFINIVDVFVILSGFFTSYFMFTKLQNGRKIDIVQMYYTRYVRFTPLYILVLSIASDFDYFLQSPQVIRIGQNAIENCKNNIWKSIFYLNNIDGIDKMCYPPSHQMATEMQMYLIAPFIILLLWKYPKIGTSLIGIFFVITAYIRYYLVHKYQFSFLIYYGTPLSSFVAGGNKIYLNPLQRLTPYLSGILLGYFIRIHGRKSYFKQWQIYIGYIIALIFSILSFGSNSVAYRTYEYDVNESARFGLLQPLLWSASFCWYIYAFYLGYGGIILKFLSWKGFQIFSKISYAFYICQIVVLFIDVALFNNSQYFHLSKFIDLNELVLLLVTSIILTLLFFFPFINLLITNKKDDQSNKKNKKTN